MTAPRPDTGAIAFAEKLITMLGEGRFTATYKYAVLLALMDLCLERSTQAGSAPGSVTTRDLAEKIVEMYWPHTAPFVATSGAVLRQNSSGQAEILTAIERFRARHAPDPSATLTRARAHAPRQFDGLIGRIEWKLVEMPLPRLQIIGEESDEFLYRIGWDTRVKRRELDAAGFDKRIRFVGDAGDHLVRLAGLLRPLIQREWSRLVARFNAAIVPDAQLEEFLFGASRESTAAIRGDLIELQSGRCFFCAGALRDDPEVDHFLPWARYPDNGIDNLVVADRRCNGSKREHLAAAEHVEAWSERMETQRADLEEIAAHAQWGQQRERTLAVARSIYLRLPASARLWLQRSEFVKVDRSRLVRVFEQAA